MHLQYVQNPQIEAETVSALRVAVGWEARKEKVQRIIGCTYLTAACFDGEQLVGFVDVISDGVDDAFIRNLLVHPRYQRKGIASKLLRITVEQIRADQIKTVNVLFEPELKALYRKAGFRMISGGIIDNEEGF